MQKFFLALFFQVGVALQQVPMSYTFPALMRSDAIQVTVTNSALSFNSSILPYSFSAPMSDTSYQVLHGLIGTTSRLRNSNFFLDTSSKTVTGLSINLTHMGISVGSTNKFTLALLAVDSSLSSSIFITNSNNLTTSANVSVSLPWAVTSPTPTVIAIIQSLSCSNFAHYSVAATLSNSFTIKISMGSSSGVSSLRAGAIVINGWVSGTCSPLEDAIVSSVVLLVIPVLNLPTANTSIWNIAFIGLSNFSPAFSDYVWNCTLDTNYCSGLENYAELAVLFFTNLTCPTGSVLSTQNVTSGVCYCLTGYYASGALCAACHYSCLNCTSSGATHCSNCNTSCLRYLSGNSCLCSSGYFDGGAALCTKCGYTCLTCTNSSGCLTCNSSTFRQLVGGQCPCLSGYYDSGISACQVCPYRCLTCSSTTACLTCKADSSRNLTDSVNCPCLSGYYDSGVAVCALCNYKCLTCQTSSTTCTTCNSSTNRNTSYLPGCPCAEGYYELGVANCGSCSAICRTCSNSSSCIACKPNLNRDSNNTASCPCLPGFFENSTLLCLACNFTCKTCSSTLSNCTSCRTTDNRVLSFSSCLCSAGYFQILSNPSCGRCPIECVSCGSLSNCTECITDYQLFNGVCLKFNNMTVTTVKKFQTANEIAMEVTFNGALVLPSGGLENVFAVSMDNQLLSFVTLSTATTASSTSFLIKFTRIAGGNVSISFNSLLLKDPSGGSVPNNPQTVELRDSYLYVGKEATILKTINNFLTTFSSSVSNARSGFILPGLLFLLIDSIEFSQLISFYLFLDMPMPGNLRSALEAIYRSSQQPILPINIPSPIPSCDCYYKPIIYDFYGLTINFLSNNFIGICLVGVVCLCFCVMNLLTRCLKPKNLFIQRLKSTYHRGFYTNVALTYISCQIPLMFESVSTLFYDRILNQWQKLFNGAAAWTILFLTLATCICHPVLLRSTKSDRKFQTAEGYGRAYRLDPQSERYIFSRLLLNSIVVVTIVTCPASWSIVVVMLACCFHILCIYQTAFTSYWMKCARMIYACAHLSIQMFLLYFILQKNVDLVTSNIVGYAVMALIVLNVLIEIIVMVVDLGHAIWVFLRKCCTRILCRKKKIIRMREKNTCSEKTGNVQQDQTKKNAMTPVSIKIKPTYMTDRIKEFSPIRVRGCIEVIQDKKIKSCKARKSRLCITSRCE